MENANDKQLIDLTLDIEEVRKMFAEKEMQILTLRCLVRDLTAELIEKSKKEEKKK